MSNALLADLSNCVAAGREGRYAEAKRLCEAAATQSARQGDLRGESNAVNLVGNALLRLGDATGARERYHRAIELAKQAGDWEAVALRLNNLGTVDYFQGRYEEAERRYAEAAEWSDRHPNAAWSAKASLTTAVNQATLMQRLGRDRAALDLYLRLKPQAKRFNPEDEGRLLGNMGALYRALGDPVKAREIYAEALGRVRASGSAHGVSGALKNLAIAEALDFQNYAAAGQLFAQVLSAARRAGDKREVMVAELYLAEIALHERRLGEAEQGWTRALVTAKSMGAAEEEWRALFGLGRVEAARGRDASGWLRQSIARIESIRQQTARGSARVEFLATRRDVYDAQLRILFGAGEVSDELLDLLERARGRAIADRPFRITKAGLQSKLLPGETLVLYWATGDAKRAIWLTRSEAGLTELAGGWTEGVPVGRRVIFVPDGGIEQEPIERGIKAEVSFLPSARLLSEWMSDEERGHRGLLVTGAGLVNAGAEGEEAARSLGGAWSRRDDRAGALGALPEADFVHVAAHAVPDYERPERSRLELAGGSLELRDVAKVRLKAELVALAACQSGVGKQVRGEGIQSLAAAFLSAGARSVVASRRPMDDGATRSFMQQFYGALARGEGKAQALQTAKRRLRESNGPMARPEHWEPWMLFGDGRRALASPTNWTRWWLGGAGLATLAALAARRGRPAGRMQPAP